MAVGDEPLGEVPANKTRAAGDEYVHVYRWVRGRAKRRRVSGRRADRIGAIRTIPHHVECLVTGARTVEVAELDLQPPAP